MIKKFIWGAILSLPIIMYSCYPKGAETVSDTNLVFTAYDDEFDFATDRSYYLYDTVIYIDSSATRSATIDNAIKNSIISNFNSLGYTRKMSIDDPNEVNIVVMAALIKNSIQGISYYPGYGGWYGGYWGGWGYGGYYPGYYPIPYSYDIGTVFIDAFDSQNLDPGDAILPPIVWSAAMNGLLSSSTLSNTSRIQTVINQAFAQSPYL
jgi:hypothetical protein